MAARPRLPRLAFTADVAAGTHRMSVDVAELVVAGWTGRDLAAVEHHIEELAAIGVPRPSRVPLYYRVARNQLQQGGALQVMGPDTSGEAEFVMVAHGGELWVTAGSDHTDRKAEAQSVALSKQLCGKVVAGRAWRYAEVAPHWDRLVLRAFIRERGRRVKYQEGPVTAMRAPGDLIRGWTDGAPLPDGTVMFCGTLAAIGGIRPADRFAFELEDPVLGRKIAHAYDVLALPVVA
jgi:hypothetical protein